MRGRVLGIDALRALAACYVVLYHLYGWPRMAAEKPDHLYYLLYPLHWGYTGVHLFLVISGFCIHMAAVREEGTLDGRFRFLNFWKRRVVRLYPPYLAAIGLSVAVGLVLGIRGLRGGTLTVAFPPSPYTSSQTFAEDILLHILMLHIFFRWSLFGLYNGPLWSLALEEQLYILYKPFGWLHKRMGIHGAVLLSGAVSLSFRLSTNCLPNNQTDPWANWLWYGPSRWFEWCLGCLAAEAYLKKVLLPGWTRQLAPAIIFYAVGLNAGFFADFLIGLASFIMLNWVAQREKDELPAPAAVKVLAGIGLWSYSLYLTHHPILQLSSWALVVFHLENLPKLVRATWMLTAVFGTAYGFFRLVERRFLRKPFTAAAPSHKSGGNN